MHHYFISMPNRYMHNTRIGIIMGNRDLSISMHTRTRTHTHTYAQTHQQVLSFFYSINWERTRNKSHKCIYDWIPFELNRIESHWLLFYTQTHSLTHSPNFNKLSIQMKFVQLLNECVAHKTEKIGDHFVSLFVDGWLADWLADFICII